MKFVCIGILQQPIGTLQITSKDLQRESKAKLMSLVMRKIPNELRSQKKNASRSLPVIYMTWFGNPLF